MEKSKNLQFSKFEKFEIWKIRIIFKLKNLKNSQFQIFLKYPIWKIQKICNFKNSKKVNSENSLKNSICKILKISKLEDSKIFPHFTIWKTIRILWISNFTNIKIKNKFENKKSNKSLIVNLIIEISKFRNIGRSTFLHLIVPNIDLHPSTLLF